MDTKVFVFEKIRFHRSYPRHFPALEMNNPRTFLRWTTLPVRENGRSTARGLFIFLFMSVVHVHIIGKSFPKSQGLSIIKGGAAIGKPPGMGGKGDKAGRRPRHRIHVLASMKFLPCQALPCLAVPGPAKLGLTAPRPAVPRLALPRQALPSQTRPRPASPCPALLR
jgi:hypothetical protein